jgi:glycerophosphoryl diester phosphodiesterase
VKVLNIAHRGASGYFPENTLSAFRGAIELGANMCELDVQLTRDGEAVVVHDDTLDRTTTGHGPVGEHDLQQIKQLEIRNSSPSSFGGERIPTLEEVLDATGPLCRLNIELKGTGVAERVCAIVTKRADRESHVVSSFDWAQLHRVRTVAPEIRLGLLAEKKPEELLERASAMNAYAIHPRFDLAHPQICAEAHRRGLKVYVWTVDAPELMRTLIDNGVDGIMTNYPDRLRAVVERQ